MYGLNYPCIFLPYATGKFCETSTASPFRICNVALYNQGIPIDTATAPEPALFAATHVLLTFTTQKNGVQGKHIGQGCSSSPFFCQVKATVHHLIYLWRCGAPSTTPLHHYQHTIDEVFHTQVASNPSLCQEPISTKKLGKGDAHWSTGKVVLGWILDTAQETIELPPWPLQHLHDILDSFPCTKWRIAVRQWHKILGKLRRAGPIPPAIQNALVSWNNPTLTITNLDLELAGTIAQHM